MKLQEVIDLFAQFGFSEGEVRLALAAGNSAYNAFEGLKTLLQLRWGEMNQELGVERLRELKPSYEALMGLQIKSRVTQGDVEQEKQQTKASFLRKLKQKMVEHQNQRLGSFYDELEKRLSPEDLDLLKKVVK